MPKCKKSNCLFLIVGTSNFQDILFFTIEHIATFFFELGTHFGPSRGSKSVKKLNCLFLTIETYNFHRKSYVRNFEFGALLG